MRQKRESASKTTGPKPAHRTGRKGIIAALLAGGVVGCLAVAMAVHSSARRDAAVGVAYTTPLTQPSQGALSPLRARLALQPEADRLRRRLGRRFLDSGREVSVLLGTLTVGNESRQVRVTRIQQDDGETVMVGFDGGPDVLAWSAAGGARAATGPVTPAQRELVERLALDSPDQFILAQLRGASYYTAARAARPVEAEGVADYDGPAWDLVRVAEPERAAAYKPLSGWRLYFINISTGLLDRVVADEQGEPVAAELSGWASQGDEAFPTRITWSRRQQAVMELTLNRLAYGPRQ